MRRLLTAVALLMVVSLALVGCGKKAETATTSTDASAAATTCPSQTTATLPKTRFVADVGLIAGSFHHFIWEPYKAGKFDKGADGRVLSLVKAAATAAFIYHLTGNAVDNVKADPLLCKVLVAPLSSLNDKMGQLADKIKGGDVSGITDIQGLVGTVEDTLKGQGDPVTETAQEK